MFEGAALAINLGAQATVCYALGVVSSGSAETFAAPRRQARIGGSLTCHP